MLNTLLLACTLFQPNDSVTNLTVINSVEIEIDQLQTDVLNNIYVLTGNTLRKYSTEGKEICHYTNNQLGFPASFDCSDPLSIQLFYPDQNKLVYLDRSFSPIAEALSLDNLATTSPIAVCNSSRESFWIINKQSLTLQCVNRNLQILIQSQPLTDIIRNNSQCKLLESENQLILLVKGKGVYLFNRFAALERFFPEAKAERATLRQNTLYVSTRTSLEEIDILTGKKRSISNPQSQMFVFPLSNKSFIGFSQKGFSILQFPETKE